MTKGFCFASDNRFSRIANWAKNSFEYTNPNIEFVIVNLDDPKYQEYDFYRWHIETKEHSFRVRNPYGFLKYFAALEFMDKENIDRLILLGADVITVGSFDKALQESEYDILTSNDIGSSYIMPLNPDVQVLFGKKFLEECKRIYMEQTINYTLSEYHLLDYQEMGILNYVCNNNLVKHKPLHEVYNSHDQCFNKNVRSGVSFHFDEQDNKVKTSDNLEVVSIHIQTGLGTFDRDLFHQKLFDCIRSSTAFSDPNVKSFVEKITKDTI